MGQMDKIVHNEPFSWTKLDNLKNVDQMDNLDKSGPNGQMDKMGQ